MGSKISKQRSEEAKNALSSKSHIPYRFLDTSKMQSSCVPNMINILRPRRDEQTPGYGPVSSLSSLAFLRDEKCLLFGTIYFSAFNESPMGVTYCSSDSLCLIDLDSGEIRNVLNSSVRDISVSSNHQYIAVLIYIGHSHLQLWQCDRALCHQIFPKLSFVDEMTQRSSVSHAICSSISPNGKWLVLAVCSNFFSIRDKNHLEIYTVNKNKLNKKQNASISNMDSGSSPEMLIISLEFSSDNEFLAAGSFAEQNSRVFLISTKSWVVILNVGENMKCPSPIWGVFNPLSIYHQLISLTRWGCLEKWDTSPLYNNLTQQVDAVDKMYVKNEIGDEPGVTSCPRFSCDGNLFAVPLSNGDVLILDPNLFQILWTIPCPNFESELDSSNIPQYLEAASVCFSKSCEYLAVGYSRDVISVWLLPRMHFTLKHFCRTKIISMCPPSLVTELPIPEVLKQYLLYQER